MSFVEADELTAEVVAEYLRDHPDFFQRRTELLDVVNIPHQQAGAVSLVEIQLKRQRERIEALEEEITTLMSHAANNDRTFHEFMSLQEEILASDDLFSAITKIERRATGLGLKAYVRLSNADSRDYQIDKGCYQNFAETMLQNRSAYLGRLRKQDQITYFGSETGTPDLGSFVILPIRHKHVVGLLAFSSNDASHFQPNMDTLFLQHLTLVFSHLVTTLPWQISNEQRNPSLA